MTFDPDEIADVLRAELRKQGFEEENTDMVVEAASDGTTVVEINPIVHAILRHLRDAA